MFHKILVPLDGSDISEAVLPQVAELAKCTGAQVVLLRVVTQSAYASLYPDNHPLERADDGSNARAQAEGYLQRVAFDRLPGNVNVTYDVSGGPIAETILDYASGIGADLIAMSTHGRSGVARMVLGSVADQIVRHSHLPILLVRPEHTK